MARALLDVGTNPPHHVTFEEPAESTQQLAQRAIEHARLDRWNDAAAEYTKIIEQNPTVAMNWLRAAPQYLRAGDEEAYALCEKMLAQFANTEVPEVAERFPSPAC